MIELVLPFPPSGNHAVRHVRGGQHYKTAEARSFERAVATIAKAERVKPFKGAVVVWINLYRGERKGRLVRGDLDGFEKVLLDSLQGFLYLNDSQIHAKHSYLREDREKPRAEVWVDELPKARVRSHRGRKA